MVVVSQHRNKTLSGKRNLPCNQFVGQTTQSILITPGAASARELLWSCIAEGVLFGSLISDRSILPRHKREIRQESTIVCIKKNILRLDIAMDDSTFIVIRQS